MEKYLNFVRVGYSFASSAGNGLASLCLCVFKGFEYFYYAGEKVHELKLRFDQLNYLHFFDFIYFLIGLC